MKAIFWSILIVLGFLVLLFGGLFIVEKMKVVEKGDGITKEDYCFWINYADKQENLIIAQNDLIVLYGGIDGRNVKWDILKERMEFCR